MLDADGNGVKAMPWSWKIACLAWDAVPARKTASTNIMGLFLKLYKLDKNGFCQSLSNMFKMAKSGFSQNGEAGKLTVCPLTFDVHFSHTYIYKCKTIHSKNTQRWQSLSAPWNSALAQIIAVPARDGFYKHNGVISKTVQTGQNKDLSSLSIMFKLDI